MDFALLAASSPRPDAGHAARGPGARVDAGGEADTRFRSLVSALAGDEPVDLDSAQEAAPSLPAGAESADDAEDATADPQVAVPLPAIPVEPSPVPVRPGFTPGRAVSPSETGTRLLDGDAEAGIESQNPDGANSPAEPPAVRTTVVLDQHDWSDQHLKNHQHLEDPQHLKNPQHVEDHPHLEIHRAFSNQAPRSSHGEAPDPTPAEFALPGPSSEPAIRVPADAAVPASPPVVASAGVPARPDRPVEPASDVPTPIAAESDLAAHNPEANRGTETPAALGERIGVRARREGHPASGRTEGDPASDHVRSVRSPVNQPAAHGPRAGESDAVRFQAPAPAARAEIDAAGNRTASPAVSALAARLSRLAGSVSTDVDASGVARFVEAAADAQPGSPRPASQPDTFDFARVPVRQARGQAFDALTFARSGLMTSPGLIHAAQPPVVAAPAAPVIALTDAEAAGNASELIQSIRLLSTRGGGEMHIRLQPRHFGDLQISVRVEDGQVVTRLMAESPVVREWLQSNQGLLRQALEEQGLSLNRLEVQESEAESRARQERQSRGDESEDGQPRRRRPDTGAVFEVVA